jgi:myo-inositol-1(or 4)-monophosphatase
MDKNFEYWRQIRLDAEYLVSEAGRILAGMQSSFTVSKLKDAVDLVTSADLAAEKFIIDFIKDKYPDHAIFSEEIGSILKPSDYQWIIDPLDGTKEYSKGLSLYNCLIAVEYKGSAIVGAMQRNGVNELYSAQQGVGSTLSEKSIHVSKCQDLCKSFIGFHIPPKAKPNNEKELEMRLLKNVIDHVYRIRPNWDDANSSVWVARGITDGYIVGPNTPGGWHDVAGALLIVAEAGGKVTDWQGNPICNHDLSHGLVMSNGLVHSDLLSLINDLK